MAGLGVILFISITFWAGRKTNPNVELINEKDLQIERLGKKIEGFEKEKNLQIEKLETKTKVLEKEKSKLLTEINEKDQKIAALQAAQKEGLHIEEQQKQLEAKAIRLSEQEKRLNESEIILGERQETLHRQEQEFHASTNITQQEIGEARVMKETFKSVSDEKDKLKAETSSLRKNLEKVSLKFSEESSNWWWRISLTLIIGLALILCILGAITYIFRYYQRKITEDRKIVFDQLNNMGDHLKLLSISSPDKNENGGIVDI